MEFGFISVILSATYCTHKFQAEYCTNFTRQTCWQ